MPGATAQVFGALLYCIIPAPEAYQDENNWLQVWAFRNRPWGEDEEGRRKRINHHIHASLKAALLKLLRAHAPQGISLESRF